MIIIATISEGNGKPPWQIRGT